MGVLASEEEDAPVGLDDDAEELYEWNKEVVVEEGQKCSLLDTLDGCSSPLLIRALARSPGTSPSSTRWMARPTSTQTSRRALHLHPRGAGGVHLD